MTIYHSAPAIPALPSSPMTTLSTVLWDRKVDGGFPETKELKRRVRDVIEPGRNLGHVDRDHGKPTAVAVAAAAEEKQQTGADGKGQQQDGGVEEATTAQAQAPAACEDCR